MSIKQKMQSRKFWAAVGGFVTPLLVCFGVEQDKALQLCALFTGGASLVAYILGESYIDGQSVRAEANEADAAAAAVGAIADKLKSR